ncbi:MAG: OmpA family protein [Lachnospiraceae bacterium]|jgi:chemotaxis protein MotB|nr:OmpA family protein [Lachnospiraceae bacterium]MCI9282520.1 OmpA family protein [Lachnospiraceae bacterium]
MSRRKKGGGGGEDCGSWMDTYGDMVTLLLCFFVMLYSMSNLDQQKWEVFVKSVFPNASDEQQIAINENIMEGEFDVSGNLETNEELDEMDELDKLYLSIVEYLSNSGVEGVSMSRGEGYAFVAFENHTFFNGDSSVLTAEATQILDVFCEAIAPNAELISQIEIMGHTAQADPNRPNRPRTDRMLSSMRSAEVAAYIQEKNIIDPSKLIGISYGQFRPVDTFETAEGRAKNRRVEFLIVDKGADIKSMNDFYDEYYSSREAGDVTITGQEHQGDTFTPVSGNSEGSASMISQPSSDIPDGAAQPVEGAPIE